MSAFRLVPSLEHFIWTLILFTYTDFKTVILPVTAFACTTAPVQSLPRFLLSIFWTWLNLLQADVSNQHSSVEEDASNRPWRPLPAGLISQQDAIILRWMLVPLCLMCSLPLGYGAVFASLTLTFALIAYNELGWAGNWAAKNFLNAIGYACFEVGATSIMSPASSLDRIAFRALLCNALLILTTIQTQDFPDIEGDKALGRVTLPIYAPQGARVYTSLALALWSLALGPLWDLGAASHMLLILFGLFVAWLFYCGRTPSDDSRAFIAYNIWLLFVHFLPSNARWRVLDF